MSSRFASNVDMRPCQRGPCSPARFCKKSLLLLPASSAACCCCCRWCCCCTKVDTRAAEYPSVSPARGNDVCLKPPRSKVSGLRPSRRTLGQSKASGTFSDNRKRLSNLISTIVGSTITRFPDMTNIAIPNQIS